MKALREAFGPLVSRTVKTTDYKTQIQDCWGLHENITGMAALGNVKDAYEEIGATYNDGKWQPLGYYVETKPYPDQFTEPAALQNTGAQNSRPWATLNLNRFQMLQRRVRRRCRRRPKNYGECRL